MEEDRDRRTDAERLSEMRMGRRRLIETLGLAGGALAASALLPSKWVKPVASQAVVPEREETSPVLGTGDLQVTLTWDTDGTDLDLWVREPTGEWVYFADDEGPTAALDVDDVDGFGPENVFVPFGGAAAGVYKVYVSYFWDDELDDESVGEDYGYPARTTVASIRITTFDGTPQQQQQTFTRTLTIADDGCILTAVADVTFPAGSIAETFGQMDNPIWGPCDGSGSSAQRPQKG